MAAKRTLKSFQSLTSASMAGNLASLVTNAENVDNIGIQVKWTSSDAIGVIAVESSINYDERLGTGDWAALTFDPALAQPASNNGSYLINLNQLPFPWYRVTYTRTSGSGTLSVWTSLKALG